MGPVIAITGASGFLGRALTRRLAGLDTVLAYSRQDGPDLIQVNDYDEVGDADVIIHCAQPSDVARLTRAGADAQRSALDLTRSLLQQSGRMLFASSAVVYGDRQAHGRRTDEPVAPVNAYAEMKLECEALVTAAGGTSIRLSNLCGPGQPAGTVLADIMQQLGQPGPLVVRNTAAVRDFLWVSDAADAIAKMLGADNLPPLLNLGSGEGVSVAELAARILIASGEGGREVQSSGPPLDSTLWLDISDTVARLHWTPTRDIAQGVIALMSKE